MPEKGHLLVPGRDEYITCMFSVPHGVERSQKKKKNTTYIFLIRLNKKGQASNEECEDSDETKCINVRIGKPCCTYSCCTNTNLLIHSFSTPKYQREVSYIYTAPLGEELRLQSPITSINVGICACF